ncbi:SAM-dependent DNA methyltransferase [Streptomyces olivaceus]|uniref:Eco57I restriction-modification methylase domain-containing protein n=1 Tax=Streptomyces olivaceus TaxID=47716 RepID=UPI0018A87102|nr:DNA methyltransferase [Streptomyces olivaceus]MBF8173357.1 SAM-dependent DNA methyltransferase [Streptomyces olivaceus]MBZ6232632.1 SAM-dependent DNA methyltransferase [Streptomyces olivaceus]
MTTLAPDLLPASTAVRVEGALLSADLINKIRFADRELPGAAPADYGLPRGVRVEDAASRKWEYLKATYASFREQLAELGPDADSAKLTEREWLRVLLDELGYAGRTTVPRRDGIEVPGRKRGEYRVSHLWQTHLPVHLLRWDTDLDRGVGTGRAPQSMVQELLNVSDRHLWALLSNGRVLRVLRDSTALVGSAYVEFDLDAIFDGDQFADFQLLYAMLHASRFELTAKPEKKRRAATAADTADADGDVADAGEGTLDEVATAADDIELTPADCRIEWWRTFAIETGIRARDRLRNQVKAALGLLGSGFLGVNPALGEALTRGGKAALDDFHHELLRLAYQLVFLFVAEDRDALLMRPAADASEKEIEALDQARDLYTRYFSTARLRRIASRRAGDHNTDLWAGLRTVLNALGQEGGLEALALPELGGLYFRFDAGEAQWTALLPGSPEPLRTADLPNENLLGAIRLLSRVHDRQGRPSRVDYRHLGADELGSVYESLLELVPRHNPAKEEFWLQDLVAGSKRKTTGSYYTPAVLIEKLLDNALDPVIDQYEASGIPDRLLDIRFVDPSCGSGHVLVAAARRIALRYARMRDNELEPAPERIREAMSKVVRNCVHGVDINPLAAEIAKVSLWLESLTPGEPLAYLDDRIKVGNALLGTTPLLLESGIPETAFKKLEGDEPKAVTEARERNRKELKGVKVWTQTRLGEPAAHTGTATVRVAAEEAARRPAGKGLAAIRELAKRHREFERDPELKRLKRVADVWCAAFIWPKRKDAPAPVTTGTLAKLERGLPLVGIPKPEPKMGEEPVEETDEEVEWRERAGERELRDIVSRNRFFHWHLEFPRVFRVEDDEAGDANPATGWQGGFDAVLGNPPWERVKIQKKEWFAAQNPYVADAATASEREARIAELLRTVDEHGQEIEADRKLHREYLIAQRESKGTTNMLRDSGIFPLTGRGDVNTYAVFAEKCRMLLAPEGVTGLVLPTGIATDKTTSVFFADLVERRQLATVLDLENEEKLFADVHNQYRFCLFTFGGSGRNYERVRLAFRARRPDQLDAREFELDAAGFARINPNSKTAPVCESPEHLRVLQAIHERVPLLWRKAQGEQENNAWSLGPFLRMLDMATDSKSFRSAEWLYGQDWNTTGVVFTKDNERHLPLYEGKFAHHFDGRFATYEKATQAQINKGTLPRLDIKAHQDPSVVPLPRHWVAEAVVDARLAEDLAKQRNGWPHGWLLGWRDVCRASDQRTVIASVLPRTAVGHKFPLMFPERLPELLLANLSAYVLDFAAKQKYAGASLAYFTFEQLPVLPPDEYAKPVPWLGEQPPESWIRSRVLELTYTSYEMAPWAEHLGDENAPFVWDEDRRFLMRAELDAAYFHLYGIERPDLNLVMDSFRAFRNKKPTLFERTKREIIRVYEEMASEAPYRTPLDPPPGQGPRHKPGTSPLTRAVPPSPPSPATGRADQPEKAQAPAKKPRIVSEADQLSGGLFGLDEIEGGDIQLDIFSSGNDT